MPQSSPGIDWVGRLVRWQGVTGRWRVLAIRGDGLSAVVRQRGTPSIVATCELMLVDDDESEKTLNGLQR